MGATRMDMHRLQEVIRLHRQGVSNREIARQLRIGRNTLSAYFRVVAWAHLLDGAADELPDVETLRAVVGEHAPTKGPAQQTSSVESWRDAIAAMREQGAGPKAIHDWLTLFESGFEGSLSAIKRMCVRLDRERGPRSTDVAIPVETDPGEVAQVDFAYVGKIYDPAKGVQRKAWLFVMTLGFSRRMYCDISFDQKVETWLELHIRGFEHFGGVPRVVVPDNLKAAVIRAAFAIDDDPAINRSYRELARHYGFRIDPTPPRAPKKKDIHGTTKRQVAQMFSEERPSLLALPVEAFRYYRYGQRTVHLDGCVEVEASYYGAPPGWIGKRVNVQWNDRWVRLIDPKTGELLRESKRKPRGWRTVHPGDKPKKTPPTTLTLLARAKRAGPSIGALCEEIHKRNKEAGVRRILGVLSLVKKYGPTRVEEACTQALELGAPQYRFVRRWIERHPLAELTLRQVDPLIRELTQYRERIEELTQNQEKV